MIKDAPQRIFLQTAHPDYSGEENDEWTDLVAVAYRALGKKEGKL